MPHLSPMPWMLFMTVTWIMLSIVVSNSWWFMNKSIKPISKLTSMNMSNKWNW